MARALLIGSLLLASCARFGFDRRAVDPREGGTTADLPVARDGGRDLGDRGVGDRDGPRLDRPPSLDQPRRDARLEAAPAMDLPLGPRKLTSLVGAPEPRRMHTYVWTGSTGNAATANRLIVWGGEGQAGRLASGGIYDPATDSWKAMSLTGAPSGRSWHRHDPIWTGATGNTKTAFRLIVWGGVDASGATTNTGAIYDPATDSWTPTSTVGAPGAISNHTAVWTGATGSPSTAHRMIIWGGGTAGSTQSGGIYNPSTDTWTPTSLTNAPAHRAYHTAVWTGATGSPSTAHRMIVWGGLLGALGGYNATSTGASYDPAMDTWSATSTSGAPSPRRWHSAVWTGPTPDPGIAHRMIVWSGQLANQQAADDGGIYDPATNSWIAIPAGGPPGRWDSRAIWAGSAMLIWKGVPGVTGARWLGGTWVAVPTIGTTTIMRYHGLVHTGNAFIEWGGEASGSSFSNAGAIFAP